MKYENDVDKFVDQLTSQLSDRNDHVSKALSLLRSTLQGDGFTLVPLSDTSPITNLRKAMQQDSDQFMVRAFRVSSSVDAEVVNAVFSSIEGWKSRALEHDGRHYVVVSNAPRLSKKRIRTALRSLSLEKKTHKDKEVTA